VAVKIGNTSALRPQKKKALRHQDAREHGSSTAHAFISTANTCAHHTAHLFVARRWLARTARLSRRHITVKHSFSVCVAVSSYRSPPLSTTPSSQRAGGLRERRLRGGTLCLSGSSFASETEGYTASSATLLRVLGGT
jgi:hypothetical protein